MNAPCKCPICEKVFVKIEDYRNHVWPLQLEETSRDYINWLGQIPELSVMSVEPSTSVKSGLNFDNDFIEISTSIDEQEFSTHPKKQLECDIKVSVKDEEM